MPTPTQVVSTHDPGADVAASRAARVGPDAAHAIHGPGGATIRFGTASWTDPTITRGEVFYPRGVDTPEERLRFYAARFSMVEVDSTYYALPARRMAELWVERTSDDFVFDLKAHALMTGQPSEVKRLPKAIREAMPSALASRDRIYGKDLPPELLDEIWRTFLDAIEPLRSAGKLGSVLLQYPRWFLPGDESRATILDARARLGDVQGTVEFRSARWFAGANGARTIQFLEAHGIPFVMVDEPQGLASSVPPVVAVTSPALAVARLHGRRAELWERRGIPVVERFRYLYDAEELAEWVPRITDVASRVREVHVVMNNCYANYGTTNALEIAELIRRVYLAS